MIGIIEYGSGNVGALMNIFKQRKIPHFLSSDPDELSQADRFILPGVGAFDPTMEKLSESGIIAALQREVMENGKHILGICVGMHLLAEGSEEGSLDGLGWISGRVRQIDISSLTAKPHLPHMGWNAVNFANDSELFQGIDGPRGFYFLHSYFFDASDQADVLATVSYGSDLPCAVERRNVHGVQFHPEKSHANGVRLLENFARLDPC